MRRLTVPRLDIEILNLIYLPRAFIRIPHKAYTPRNKRLLISPRMNERDQQERERERERERDRQIPLLHPPPAPPMADE